MKEITPVRFEDLSIDDLYLFNNKMMVINKENVNFYLKIFLKESSKTLIAFSNGVRDPQKKESPFFSRSSWHSEINSHCVYFDDPTVHNTKYRVGWAIGTKDHYYLNSISEITKKIMSLLKIKSKNVVYFGSSAGGFISAMLASLHKDSSAIINNPQFYVEKERSINFIKDIHPDISEEKIDEIFEYRFSFYKFQQTNGYFPEIIYLLNRMSKSDVLKQYIPFTEFLDENIEYSNKVEFVQYHSPGGHGAMYSRDKTIHLINNVIEEKLVGFKKRRCNSSNVPLGTFEIYNSLDENIARLNFSGSLFLPSKFYNKNNYSKVNFTYKNIMGMLKLSVLSKYISLRGKHILRYEIIKNKRVLAHEDMASWNKVNDINIYNLKKGDVISIKIITQIDSSRNSWVNASVLDIVSFEEIPMKTTINKQITFNSPYMYLS